MHTIYLSHYADCPLNQKYKTEHELGLSLLSYGLSELYHLDFPKAGLARHLTLTAYGKPFLNDYPDICFNISHCDGLAACIFSDTVTGLDTERIGSFNEHILRKVFTQNEKALLEQYKNDKNKYQEIFYRLWTLKESRIKQSGLGLSMPLTGFSFHIDMTCEPCKITCSEAGLYFHQQIFEQNYVISVCSQKPVQDIRLILR